MNSNRMVNRLKLFSCVVVVFLMQVDLLRAESARQGEKLPTIVIDAGHGGDEAGAKGLDGIYEKDVTLNVVKDIEDLFKENPWGKVLLTRNTDVKMTLQERADFANTNKADVFVSIHTNASEYHTASGIETYYLDNTDDSSAMRLANRENLVTVEASSNDLNFIVSDLIQTAKMGDSIALANILHRKLVEKIGAYYEGVKDLGVKKAPFYVLVGAHMPCVLMEISFIDHPTEGKRLGDRRYQRLIASAVFNGLKDYFAQIKKDQQK